MQEPRPSLIKISIQQKSTPITKNIKQPLELILAVNYPSVPQYQATPRMQLTYPEGAVESITSL